MKIEIQGSDDNFFSIQLRTMGEVVVGSDGKRSCIAKTSDDAIEFFESLPAPVEEVKEEVVEEIPHNIPRGAPIENFKSGNFDLFEGTSWAGRKQPH